VLKTLESLGFPQLDARVYVLLAKKGPQKAIDAAKVLKMPRQTLYVIIKNLQKKGIVASTVEHPARFVAVPFEKVIDLFIKSKMEEAQRVQQRKNEILLDWESIAIADPEEKSAKFNIMEGRNTVYSKIQQMIQETKKQLQFVTNGPSLVRADQAGLFDAAFNHPLRSKISFRFITDLSDQNAKVLKALLEKKPAAILSFKGRTPDSFLSQLPRMIVRDNEEAIFFIEPKREISTTEQDYVCLWTNCKTLVDSFSALFEDLWSKSTNIQNKILEIETGKPVPRTYVISEAQAAKKKYEDVLHSAKKEITIMTSSEGLCLLSKRLPLIRFVSKGLSVKIMAPIVNENLGDAQQLLRQFEVKHVPSVYLDVTIVDEEHFFQFKKPHSNRQGLELLDNFENTFYTSDHEYIKRTQTILGDIWKKAYAPSAITLKSTINASSPTTFSQAGKSRYAEYRKIIGWIEETDQCSLTEKDVLDKIINAKKIIVKNPQKDVGRAYFSSGLAVIHPPVHFNLPDFIVFARHVDKQSSMGAEDMLAVYLWLETPNGYAYVRAGTAGDNPRGVKWRKTLFAGTPIPPYCHLLKKDEIQVHLHGNTLFAGWAVPIPLFPQPYILPPACIQFEGYGELKTGVVKTRSPIGRTEISEFNGYDAFVTFFHPASKYSGPGTDGLLRRDVVMTSYPPTE
jgi:sugar-specific transcriptional regulator TrmB